MHLEQCIVLRLELNDRICIGQQSGALLLRGALSWVLWTLGRSVLSFRKQVSSLVVDRELGGACSKGIRHMAWASIKTAWEMSKRALNRPSVGMLARLSNTAMLGQITQGRALPSHRWQCQCESQMLGAKQAVSCCLFCLFVYCLFVVILFLILPEKRGITNQLLIFFFFQKAHNWKINNNLPNSWRPFAAADSSCEIFITHVFT